MKPVIIIGGGSSIKEGIEKGLWEKIQGKAEIWSINFAYKFLPYLPQRQIWMDTTFFKNYIQDLQKLSEAGVKLCTMKHDLYNSPMFKDKINQFEHTTIAKYDDFKNKVFASQGLSGGFALSLAVKEGYTPIYILGYDYGTPSFENRNTHFYQDKIAQNKIESSGIANTEVYMQRNNAPQPYVTDYDIYNQFHNKIVNVSLISNLSSFEKIGYDEFFERLINAGK